ncbi:hypothetical protein F2P44_21465 [Massilia sp. CCM 8695]|uniref:Bacteriophage tail tape measure N-terminal domain-containing protein n=1 Tax=Massilia frigida TaxID=2609281 RepID=A0ABX0N8U6_9BURK|nr:hypothetical protein [Massilia frigida]NHZ81825.1 hypothetical protein [Massilia frigida]
MSEITNTATIKVAVDADGVETGLRKIDDAAAKTGRNLDNLGKGDSAFAKIGAGGDAAAVRVQAASKSLADAVATTQAAMAEGSKASAAYYASLANSKATPESVKPFLAQIEALTAAEKNRAETFATGLEQTKSLFAIAGAAATTAQQQIAAMRLDSDQLIVPDEAIQSLKNWHEAAAYAVGTAVGGGVAAAKVAFEHMTDFIKTKLIIAGAAAAIGISAAVLGATYAAYKTIDFAAGLLTGDSYKSANIDALAAANKEVVDLQKNFRLSANEASGLVAALAGLGVSKIDYVDTFREAGAAIKANSDELDALGVKYKDAAGNLLPMRDVLVNVQAELAKYTSGLERNAVAAALGFGSSEKIDAALGVTAEKLAAVTERQREYGLLIGGTQQAELARYASVMAEFNVELDNTSQGFKRAIADNIMPALTNLADFFKEGWPVVVQAFRGTMAGFTTLFYGLKTVVDIVVESVKATFGLLAISFEGVVKVIGNLIKGDFSAAAASAGEIWDNAMARISKAGDKIVEYARANVSAIKMAWGQKMFPDEVQLKAPELKTADSAKDVIKRAAEVREQAAAYKTLSASMIERIALLKAEADGGARLSDGQKLALEFTRELATGKSKLTDEQKKERTAQIETLIALEKTIEKNAEGQKAGASAATAAAAAASKQASEYANLGQAIQSKIDANKLELLTSEAVSESQKLGIKLDLELASGKLKLTAAQVAATKASLAELAVTEQKLKLQAAEKGTAEYIKQNTLARQASAAALASEYALYGKGADARDLAAVGLRNEAELQKKLADMQKANLPVTQQMIDQMTESARARTLEEKATLAQTKALGYAAQLDEENARFAAESIVDERARAAELIELEAEKWRKKIELCEDGLEAQKLLQSKFDTWYKNQSGKPAMDEWRKSVQQYDDIFRNGFADMLNNGKDGWKSFTKSLVTTFKTSVADQIYKMFIKPLIVQVVGSVVNGGSSGGSGGSGLLSMGQSIYEAFTKGSSNGSGMLDMGKKLFEGFGGAAAAASSIGAGAAATGAGASAVGASTTVIGTGFGGIGASAGALTAGVGSSAVGVGGTATVGAGGGVGAAGAIPIAGWIAAGMAMSNALYKQGWDAQNGTTSATKIPFNAPMLNLNKGLQKLGMNDTMANMFSGASTVSRLFGRKNPEVKDFGIEGTFGASGFDGKTFQNILEKGGLFRKDKNYTKDGALDAAGESTFDDTIKNLMTAVKGFGAQMGIEASQIDKYTKAIKLTLTGDEAKNQELITGLFGDIGNDLAKLLIPTLDTLTAKGEKAGDALQRIAINYAVVDAGLASIGKTFGAVGIGSLTAREKLVELSGGIDNFSKGISFFSQNYQTEAERMAALGKTVDAAFASLEITAPKTRDEFKTLALGLDLTTEKGAKTFAGLMNIQEAFAQLNPAMEVAATAVRSLADIASERAGLQDQFDQLRMTPEEYRQQQVNKQRDALDPSNRDLFDNVQNGQIANSTNVAAANAAETLRATNKSYQDQIDVFVRSTMKVEDVRKLEIAGMDATTVALYDLLKGYQTAAASATAAKDAADKLASTNKGYQDQIDTMLKAGMTAAEVRKLETKGMDASTLALYDKLKGLEADKLAKDKADQDERDRQAKLLRDGEDYRRIQEQLADDAKRAAEQMRDAWQSVTDSIFDEVKRIRGLAAGDGASTLASVQAEFATRTAQAQSGNQDAAKLLPSISQKLIELAEANATSLLDLQRIRARTAASLDATGAILAAKFGLTLPSLAVGTNYLPADMVIQAHEGERVIPAADNRALMQMINRPASADASAASQQQASAEMAGLRAEVVSIALSSAEMARMLKRVIKDDKLQTEDA